MVAARRRQADAQRHPRFPPRVRMPVFLEAVRALAQSGAAVDGVLATLGDNDRSQVRGALEVFGLIEGDDIADEVTLRRLADDGQRPAALRALLEDYYRPELQAIREGVDARELGGMLVAGRSSESARQKARQFLLRAINEADMDLPPVGRTPRRARSGTVGGGLGSGRPAAGARTSRGVDPDSAIALHERFAEQLLDRHQEVVARGGEDPEQLEARIERVLHVLRTLRPPDL